MLAVRTPGAPQTARVVAACGSAFPFERKGRLLRSRSISGLFSRSLHSGLQPPCLRFATAVTGRHARLSSRLLARLCRGRHRRRQTSTRLQGATPKRNRSCCRSAPPKPPDGFRRTCHMASPSLGGFFRALRPNRNGGRLIYRNAGMRRFPLAHCCVIPAGAEFSS